MQGVHSNYEIDLFRQPDQATAEVLGVENDGSSSLNVIADHIRACSFLIVDGVLPGNEGRGYVLRRIIRRAIRHGKKLGTDGCSSTSSWRRSCKEMGDAYPELVKAQAHVEKVLDKEERRFAETLDQGMEILERPSPDSRASSCQATSSSNSTTPTVSRLTSRRILPENVT